VAELATPRAMIRAMLQGIPLARPLVAPIVFSLGARLENLPLREFLSNPTKIASALRQLRGALALDGVTCYFDPYLEAEALGCDVRWNEGGASRTLQPPSKNGGALRERLPSAEETVHLGRIPVACEVVRRLKVMLPGEPALAAGVTGPCALALQLTGEASAEGSVFNDAMEFAAEVTVSVCKSLLDAGASVIFLREDFTVIQGRKRWADLLNPVINVIRFYEALPVVLPAKTTAAATLKASSGACEGLICPVAIEAAAVISPQVAVSGAVFLPIQELLCSESNDAAMGGWLQSTTSRLALSFITTQEDIAADTDIRRLASLFKSMHGGSRRIA
jgi:hypothetical protein